MKYYVRRILFVVTVVCCLTACKAPIIGSAPLVSGLGSNKEFYGFTFWLTIGNSNKAFEIEFYGDETGNVYQLEKGAVFEELVTLLSNGQNDDFSFGINAHDGGGSGRSFNEAFFFFGDGSGDLGVDFEGYSISGIELVVNEIALEQDSGWTNASYDFSLNIRGVSLVEE